MTPQEKKIRDYVNEKRNVYGENDKSSRKAIKSNKVWVNRCNRRNQKRVVNQFKRSAQEIDDNITMIKRKKWNKYADWPLAIALEKSFKRRLRLGIINKIEENDLRAEARRRIRKKYGIKDKYY